MNAVAPRLITLPDGQQCLVWSDNERRRQLSSASVGGGLSDIDWIVNLQVPAHYSRRDLDAHAAEVVQGVGMSGDGVAMLTAAAVEHVATATESGVRADATVGISTPTWAAGPDSGGEHDSKPGTINIVVQLPVELSLAAAVNAVMTATEAKTQALIECGIDGTGTATDAIVVTWPATSAGAASQLFAGPRSTWGARLARVVHSAVLDGVTGWQQR
ncbi:MAG: adenosylcobinamide hydrolase [Candidatus Aldehydirespiratoraceae bacterium]|jgi:adenosylcobinamide amidohydrolase